MCVWLVRSALASTMVMLTQIPQDEVNRSVIMKELEEKAVGAQFLFMTPLEIRRYTDRQDVRVIRLPDPARKVIGNEQEAQDL